MYYVKQTISDQQCAGGLTMKHEGTFIKLKISLICAINNIGFKTKPKPLTKRLPQSTDVIIVATRLQYSVN